MNRFLTTFLAVFMAAGLALLGYDYLIVQPRETARNSAAEVRLDTAQAQASEIAKDLDDAVRKSVDNANQGMNAQAAELQQRSLANDALARASMFKTALAEYFMSTGHWPDNGSQAGLANPESYAGGAVSSISVAEKGVVIISLDDRFETGAKIKLVPQANVQSYVINWRCISEGSEALKRYLPACPQ